MTETKETTIKRRGGKKTTSPVVETRAEEQPNVTEPTNKAEDFKVLSKVQHQMGIHSNYVYSTRFLDVKIVVKNEGYGDLYVSTESPARVGVSDQLLLTGEERTFENVDKLYMTSASQPLVTITEIR